MADWLEVSESHESLCALHELLLHRLTHKLHTLGCAPAGICPRRLGRECIYQSFITFYLQRSAMMATTFRISGMEGSVSSLRTNVLENKELLASLRRRKRDF